MCWKSLNSLSPSLKLICYKGDKRKRVEIQREVLKTSDFHLILTTYELALKDASFLRQWQWKILVVDEAHRLKNQKSMLHQTLTQFSVEFRVLLTGTPIQNNLQELYSLLTFIQPNVFNAQQAEDFSSAYCGVQKDQALAAELQSLLEPFLLRRMKWEVALDVPRKQELVVYHGMSSLQKKLYKAVLMKDVEAFGSEQKNRTRLLNILMNLRKCVNHPYLFPGVEPEPFEMGEHLVEASGKLGLLDTLLSFLHNGDHRVLLFSQMTRMLDLLQDYVEFRGYSYQRLDGSVRGEDRNQSVKTFSSKQVFLFLLSTRAGGVGLNLTAADTVIFVDTDFNPQNDLQAAARCHRIGQNRPVKVIRLLARHTVEEIMFSKAVSKLNLTNTVIEEGRFSLLDQAQSGPSGLQVSAGFPGKVQIFSTFSSHLLSPQLSEILKVGVDQLLSSEESSVQEVKLEKILGLSEGGQWLDDEELISNRGEEEEEQEEDSDSYKNHIYYFEGRDYSKDPCCEDHSRFEQMVKEQLEEVQRSSGEGRTLRHKAGVSLLSLAIPVKKRKLLTSAAENEQHWRKMEEAVPKRRRTQEETKKKKKRAELKFQKK
ncbi:chromodomain-helicase-DNA-binding protein 1-like isoform X2 [Cynoglossus semilaevis]|uniref:chromodomain-helicase-DNA-binding protein 1-like isoform X2 n=1 Tax=Cynoglossus semilaevis TaxID=244447 RepID=UPI000495E7F2|nr:chromodomain-helicase-DNA-binding protein 1-like isoform X2 [Cynoglossus semilaevis]